jgi:cytochrome c oxidase subunit 2
MTSWLKLNLQNIISEFNHRIDLFHDLVLFLLIIILFIVLFQLISLLLNKTFNLFVIENSILETVWTIIPGVILVGLGVPSLHTLYLTESSMASRFLTIKATGHQWYWSYEIRNQLDFNSYILPERELVLGQYRLLEVDNKLVAPIEIAIRIITSSSDVIHSWAIPSIGIKIDCTPGRLNQLVIKFYSPSIFYGQCSEICGSNHSFMPIAIEATSFNLFKLWFNNFSN